MFKYKLMVIILVLFSEYSPAWAVTLRLYQINTNRTITEKFTCKYKFARNSQANFSLDNIRLKLSDFKMGRYPLAVMPDIKQKTNLSLMRSKVMKFSYKNFRSRNINRVNSDKNFLERHNVLKFVRDRSNYDRTFLENLQEKIQYGTPLLQLRGNVKVLTGELHVFRVKVSELQQHLNDLNHVGIKIIWNDNPGLSRIIVDVAMGNIVYYYSGLDDISEKVSYYCHNRNDGKGKIRIRREEVDNPNLYFNIVYATDVKKENIKVNFNVPLKWKSIKFPKYRNSKLVTVKTEGK